MAEAATLTIEPGVTVRFRQGCGLRVNGRLLADGTPGQPVTFTRYPGDATWERMMFVEAADSRLQHCVIEYANCVGDHKDYYPTNCSPESYPPRKYHEAVVVLACHVDFDGCSFTNLPNASATAEGDAIAIISDDKDHFSPASATVRNCNPAFDLAESPSAQDRGSHVTVLYCDVQGGQNNASVSANSTLTWGPGNIDSDPLFASAGATNSSPAAVSFLEPSVHLVFLHESDGRLVDGGFKPG